MNYLLHILIMINIYAILTLSLNIVVGYSGLLSLCQAAFYGIGAYITTLLMMKAGMAFLPAMGLAIIGVILLSYLIALPSLRLKGDYFVLATLGFQIIIFVILYNWVSVTRGPYGIPGIPNPEIFGLTINNLPGYFIFSLILALICGFLMSLLLHSPFGRALKTVREDELAAAALGKNVPRLKTQAFVIGAAFAAVPGALFAMYFRYIDPTSFTLMESIFILSIIIIGGTGNIKGPIAGSIFLVLLPEVLRFLQIPDAIAANMRQIIYGLTLVVLLQHRPQGLFGEYRFE
ncbi:MAG: branched-chain amino acid ABC transporter permease [candidate division KSB1 bacterium]|nr:branched-chain amino acid ABC transporter permease [candidate division KSB1 bacterium]